MVVENQALEANSSVKSIVFISAKKGNFIAGADIQAFTDKAKEGKDAVKEISAQLQVWMCSPRRWCHVSERC